MEFVWTAAESRSIEDGERPEKILFALARASYPAYCLTTSGIRNLGHRYRITFGDGMETLSWEEMVGLIRKLLLITHLRINQFSSKGPALIPVFSRGLSFKTAALTRNGESRCLFFRALRAQSVACCFEARFEASKPLPLKEAQAQRHWKWNKILLWKTKGNPGRKRKMKQ